MGRDIVLGEVELFAENAVERCPGEEPPDYDIGHAAVEGQGWMMTV